MPPDPFAELRADLRRLWRAAPGGTWTAPREQALPGAVVAVDAEGRRTYFGAFFYGERASALTAAARNALPVLFQALDDARAERSVSVLGDVGTDGAVTWRTTPPDPAST